MQAVAERARRVGAFLAADVKDALLAAAYVHDSGYASALAKTGFYPLDGAFFLRALGHERLAALVKRIRDEIFTPDYIEAEVARANAMLAELARDYERTAQRVAAAEAAARKSVENLGKFIATRR